MSNNASESVPPPVRQLVERVTAALGNVHSDVFVAPAGVSVDLSFAGRVVALQWSPDVGVGLTALVPDKVPLGSGHDEVYATIDEAIERVVYLLRTGEPSQPPIGVMLRELRVQRGLSQVDVAKRMGVTQSKVSKLEAKRDVSVSQLRSYAHAVGARLDLRVWIGGDEVASLG